MSDSDDDVRLIVTTTFATLAKLVPLEAGIPYPPGLSEELLKGLAIKAELRSYQKEGVNWLAFLNEYHLHGILYDDMGLGKILEIICIIASDYHLRAEEFARTKSPEKRRLPSLIVCPPALSAERASVRAQLGSTDIVTCNYGRPGFFP
ncbi:TATA-binding protein-associated factor mot1 [Rhizina undulata]